MSLAVDDAVRVVCVEGRGAADHAAIERLEHHGAEPAFHAVAVAVAPAAALEDVPIARQDTLVPRPAIRLGRLDRCALAADEGIRLAGERLEEGGVVTIRALGRGIRRGRVHDRAERVDNRISGRMREHDAALTGLDAAGVWPGERADIVGALTGADPARAGGDARGWCGRRGH